MQRSPNLILLRINRTMSEYKAQSKHTTNRSLPISQPNIGNHNNIRNTNNRNYYLQIEENAIKQMLERAKYQIALQKRQQAQRLFLLQIKISLKKDLIYKQTTSLQQKIFKLKMQLIQIYEKYEHTQDEKKARIKRCHQQYLYKKKQQQKRKEQQRQSQKKQQQKITQQQRQRRQYLRLKEKLAFAQKNQDQFIIDICKKELQLCKKRLLQCVKKFCSLYQQPILIGKQYELQKVLGAKLSHQMNEQIKQIQIEYSPIMHKKQEELKKTQDQIKYLRQLNKQKYMELERIEEQEFGNYKLQTDDKYKFNIKLKNSQFKMQSKEHEQQLVANKQMENVGITQEKIDQIQK